MGFNGAVLLSSRARFYTIFLKTCGVGENLRTTTFVKSVVVRKQGHVYCETFVLFIVSLEFHTDQ